jgi:RsiW-degrading membrane proteinase PrsW (M82 family)
MFNQDQLDLIFPIVGAVCGAMLWLGYFKRIDILEHEKITDTIIAFIIGFLTPTLALWIYYGLEILGFNFNGELINDFFYSIFGVGLTEEISKLIGVLIAFKIIKKRINEPIDYLVFAGVVALVF